MIEIFMAGVARANPEAAVIDALDGVRRPDLILALGKAAVAMARPALSRFPGTPCLVVTNPENAATLDGAEVILGGHPVPDDGSLAAGQALLSRARALSAGQHCLVLVSGGGSALAVAPAGAMTLADKADVSRLLLGAGLDITAMNLVRQNLSLLKGGGLARALAPATAEALILSDVVGDDLAAIASGPMVPPLGTAAEAIDLLRRQDLWDRMPAAARDALGTAEPIATPEVTCRLVGSNRLSAEAMHAAAPDARLDPDPLVGDVSDAAARIVAVAQAGPGTTLWGGETTVILRGDGRGGRNQELALRVADALRGFDRPWAFLSGGTDGRDGPTDAAGALVDNGTLARAAARGCDVTAALARNDSYAVLAASGDLLMTGGTGTNVADLQILRVGG
ncbi:glycerate kinase [Jannaschia sp. 2305UL9-9]|uniref:glycerate kinase type-2 family protein n=1 Tax=Jannaschia sp. 2305UL9-9 TaxID=3121638 RepID=UPI00352871A7